MEYSQIVVCRLSEDLHHRILLGYKKINFDLYFML